MQTPWWWLKKILNSEHRKEISSDAKIVYFYTTMIANENQKRKWKAYIYRVGRDYNKSWTRNSCTIPKRVLQLAYWLKQSLWSFWALESSLGYSKHVQQTNNKTVISPFIGLQQKKVIFFLTNQQSPGLELGRNWRH